MFLFVHKYMIKYNRRNNRHSYEPAINEIWTRLTIFIEINNKWSLPVLFECFRPKRHFRRSMTTALHWSRWHLRIIYRHNYTRDYYKMTVHSFYSFFFFLLTIITKYYDLWGGNFWLLESGESVVRYSDISSFLSYAARPHRCPYRSRWSYSLTRTDRATKYAFKRYTVCAQRGNSFTILFLGLTLMFPSVPSTIASLGSFTLKWLKKVDVLPSPYFKITLASLSNPDSVICPQVPRICGVSGPKIVWLM